MERHSKVSDMAGKISAWLITRAHGIMQSTKGQGTTEYAILVGVLVVIAIIAIALFRDRLQQLWDAIRDGINNL